MEYRGALGQYMRSVTLSLRLNKLTKNTSTYSGKVFTTKLKSFCVNQIQRGHDCSFRCLSPFSTFQSRAYCRSATNYPSPLSACTPGRGINSLISFVENRVARGQDSSCAASTAGQREDPLVL